MKQKIQALLLVGLIATIIWALPLTLHSNHAQELEAKETSSYSLTEKITLYADKYGVDQYMARDIMWCESRLYPDVTNQNRNEEGVVWSTDYGYWQLNDYY